MFSQRVSLFPMRLGTLVGASRFSAPLKLTSFSLPTKPIIVRTMAVQRHRTGASSRPKPPPRPVATQTQQEYQQQQQYQQNQQQASVPSAASHESQQPAGWDYQNQSVYDGRTSAEHINESASLQEFLKRSMKTTALAVGGSALVAAAIISTPFPYAHPYITLGVGVAATFGGIIGMGYMQPTYSVQNGIIVTHNSPQRLGMFGLMMAGQGIALAPMLAMVSMYTPTAIPVAGALAVGTMAGMGAYALKQPQGSLAKWGPALYVGCFGLMAAGILNIFIGSSTLSLVNAGFGILVFSGFTAYDTHIAIQEHNEGRPDHLQTAANFYMNFVNLFLSYLRLIRGFFE